MNGIWDNDGAGDECVLEFFTYITINITFYQLFYGPYIPHPGIFKTMSYFLWSVKYPLGVFLDHVHKEYFRLYGLLIPPYRIFRAILSDIS
ncbi:hypothetical protein HMPREF9709_01526 [Helcococcus kunzii ATCC 51366]|uniref:Uncharacterized protein n=1 Tax=Helcococcus kunzii ATCC 51366 TaxID=883114 RepID=H3NQB5_9FIRM|nr:hypothetical protein HMPREF9709_01526 [Helcococcus kunzii ATCC 51366]